MSNLISASEMARRLDVPQTTFSGWLLDGRVPNAVKVSNMWLVPEDTTIDDINRPKMGRPTKSNGVGVSNQEG